MQTLPRSKNLSGKIPTISREISPAQEKHCVKNLSQLAFVEWKEEKKSIYFIA